MNKIRDRLHIMRDDLFGLQMEIRNLGSDYHDADLKLAQARQLLAHALITLQPRTTAAKEGGG